MRTARTAVETLRRAAVKAERLADKTWSGPWRTGLGRDGKYVFLNESRRIAAGVANAPHIAAWHPGVAKALAKVWREHADLDECHMLADCAVLAAAATFLGEDA